MDFTIAATNDMAQMIFTKFFVQFLAAIFNFSTQPFKVVHASGKMLGFAGVIQLQEYASKTFTTLDLRAEFFGSFDSLRSIYRQNVLE